MAKRVAQTLTYLYSLLVRLYPLSFRNRFGDEMQSVFAAALDEAARQGARALATFCLRELCCTPLSLLRVYWSGFLQETRAARNSLPPLPALLPPALDGRASWLQAGLEIGPFLLIGIVLVLQTYFSLSLPSPSPPYGPGDGSAILLLLAVPLFLIGLARGLPRWAYPSGGIVLGYSLLAAIRFRQLPTLVISVLAFAALTAAALAIHWWVRPLPAWLQRLGQSIKVDWTRLSFCVYGAMPLTIATAFDDAYLDSRTPYLAIAALFMVAGALVYARSRRAAVQMATLVVGTSLCLVCALLDHANSIGGKGVWIARSGWLIWLWVMVSALTCVPFLFSLAWRALHNREASRL